MKIFRFNIATWVHFRLVQYIFRICQLIFSWSPHTLKALTAILAPQVTLPNSTHSQTSTSPFHSSNTTKVYICCKHSKTAHKTHCWLRPKPSWHDPFLCWSEILWDENSKQIKHTFGRLTGISVPCSPVAMPPVDQSPRVAIGSVSLK